MPCANAGDRSTGVQETTAAIAVSMKFCLASPSAATSMAVAIGAPISDPSRFKLKLSVTLDLGTPAGGVQQEVIAAPTSCMVERGSAAAHIGIDPMATAISS